jgi:hypothetical protein
LRPCKSAGDLAPSLNILTTLILIVLFAIPVSAQTRSGPPQECRTKQLKTSAPVPPDGGLSSFAYPYEVINISSEGLQSYRRAAPAHPR